jgi:hypothetical protein
MKQRIEEVKNNDVHSSETSEAISLLLVSSNKKQVCVEARAIGLPHATSMESM